MADLIHQPSSSDFYDPATGMSRNSYADGDTVTFHDGSRLSAEAEPKLRDMGDGQHVACHLV